MPISEAARADLYTGLRELLGPERTETLMTALPLYELDEVATKGDLSMLKSEIKAELGVVGSLLGSLGSRVDRIESKLDRLIWVLIAGLFGIIAMLGGVIATLLRLGS